MRAEERVRARLEELLNTAGKFPTGLPRFGREAETLIPLLAWVGNVHTLLKTLVGEQNYQTRQLELLMQKTTVDNAWADHLYQAAMASLQAMHSDYIGGHLVNLRAEIRSDVEASFLDQARRFLDDGLKDSAAMLIGAVLEDSLRALCRDNGIPEGNNISTLNEALRKANIYNKNQWGMIDSWARFRNSAAHGKFGDYQQPHIELMHQGVAHFIHQYLA